MTFRSAKAFLSLLLVTAPVLAEVNISANKPLVRHITSNQTREAYAQPFAGLNEEELSQFYWWLARLANLTILLHSERDALNQFLLSL
jgi:hypothetical protein